MLCQVLAMSVTDIGFALQSGSDGGILYRVCGSGVQRVISDDRTVVECVIEPVDGGHGYAVGLVPVGVQPCGKLAFERFETFTEPCFELFARCYCHSYLILMM